MKAASKLFSTACVIIVLIATCATGATVKNSPAIGPYLITNDNITTNTATIYKILANGSLTLVTTLTTGGTGNLSGFFATANINVPRSTAQACAFVSDGNPNFVTATIPDVAAINLKTLKVVGTFPARARDNGSDDGVALADAGNFLIAAFSGNTSFFQPPTLGTYQILAGCKLKYLGSITALGLNRGTPIGIKATPNGKILIVSYSDSSVGSFSISATGKLKLIGQEATSTGALAAGVDITADGKWVIFGDAATPPAVDVAPIKSNGALGPTVNYSPFNVSANSNNVLLSPDGTVLFVGNNSLGTVAAAPFSKSTGKVDIAHSCTSGILKLFDLDWFDGAGLSFSSTTGTGGKIYLAQVGFRRPVSLSSSTRPLKKTYRANGTKHLLRLRLTPISHLACSLLEGTHRGRFNSFNVLNRHKLSGLCLVQCSRLTTSFGQKMRRRPMTPVVITITFKQQAQWKETRTKPEGEKTTGPTHWLN